jgi:hypothetical protein
VVAATRTLLVLLAGVHAEQPNSDKAGRPDATLVWKRYGHLYPGSTREAAAALDRHLGALAG